MTLTLNLPDEPAARRWTEAELRLELACAMHARGHLSKAAGAMMAGVDFFAFQAALGEREICTYSVEDLHAEVATLREAFPEALTLQAAR